MIGAGRLRDLLRRWPVLVAACLSASFLTYILPEIVSVVLHPETAGVHNIAFPLLMSVVAGLDLWLLLAASLAWLGPGRGVRAGGLAGAAYLALAVAFSFVTPISNTPFGEVAVRIALTPFVQARVLALHRLVGWSLPDPPLGWSFVLAPLAGCTFGGWLYSRLSEAARPNQLTGHEST